jgi:methylphosphotriester-DNA--protein-cysteine methyltransferase
MNFHQFPASPALQSAISCYWIIEGNETAASKIIPDGSPEMIFHFGDPYEIFDDQSTARIQPLSLVAGQLTRPITIRPTGKSGVFGVKFFPAGLWKLFKINMRDLQNETLYLDEVMGVKTQTFRESLADAETHADRVCLADNFFLSHVSNLRTSALDTLINRIDTSQTSLSLQQLCVQENVSARKLERTFNEVIGVSAKMYMRLSRFSRAFKTLQQNELSKADITYLYGYFDQSHFNRDFKIFSGENPGSYFQHNHAMANFFINR